MWRPWATAQFAPLPLNPALVPTRTAQQPAAATRMAVTSLRVAKLSQMAGDRSVYAVGRLHVGQLVTILVSKSARAIFQPDSAIFCRNASKQCFDAVGWAAGRASGL